MQKWPHKVYSYTPEQVQKHCVRDQKWQEFRKGLKGLSTVQKLITLDLWLKSKTIWDGKRWVLDEAAAVQASNYINALKRGGFLNTDLEAVK